MHSSSKTRVAFVKFAGMTIGGSELWLQKIAANLPKDRIVIDFYYCDDAPYAGADHPLLPSSDERIQYLKDHGVNVIKFSVGSKNLRSLTHDWIDTDFWQKFDQSKYDIIQTVKAGPREYPFYKIQKPVVEIVALANRPDTSKNIAWSFHSSNWQRARWVRLGGPRQKSSVLTAPVEAPQSTENYREELGIPADAIVAGFHQRNDNNIASEIPLQAFADLQKKHPSESKKWHFIIKNGGSSYRAQAERLGITNIHFLEPTPDSASVSKFLNTLDVFAHGRKDGETFGAVFVEAMIHGKPCLSLWSKDGANAQPETMGPAGVFAYSQQEYSDLLYRFFSDAPFRDHLATKAMPHAEKYYSMDKCVQEILEVYGNICSKRLTDIKSETSELPIPYGYSDMGFLYAGDMNKTYNIAYHVLVGGIPEAFDVAIVRALLPYTKSFFDIGANTGIYCWIAAHHYSKNKIAGIVHTFEPQTDCVKALETTRSLNNWESLVTVHPIGLGEKVGMVTLHLSGTGSSVADDFAGTNLPTQTIKIDTFDNIVSSLNNSPVDFVKIDVEGFELSVLKGGTKTIQKNIPILFIEIADRIKSRNYKNKDYGQTLTWLFDRGYRIWTCENNRIKEIKPGFHNGKITMYLCLHKEKHAKLVSVIEKAASDYRKNALVFGIVEKRRIIKAIHKVIPAYITPRKILNYGKRFLKK